MSERLGSMLVVGEARVLSAGTLGRSLDLLANPESYAGLEVAAGLDNTHLDRALILFRGEGRIVAYWSSDPSNVRLAMEGVAGYDRREFVLTRFAKQQLVEILANP